VNYIAVDPAHPSIGHYAREDIKQFMRIMFKDLLKVALHSERQRWVEEMREKIDKLYSKQEFVTYKKDSGHGIAVPCSEFIDLLDQLSQKLKVKKTEIWDYLYVCSSF